MAKTTSFLCRLPSETYESLQTRAGQETRSMNSIVVDAVEQYLGASPEDALTNALYTSTRTIIGSSVRAYASATGSSFDDAVKQLAGIVEENDDISEEPNE